MRRLTLSTLALGAALLAAPAAMAGDSAMAIMAGKGYSSAHGAMGYHGTHRWGPRYNGRWYAGWRAPGGWGAWQRPVYGYVLPRYWVQPSFYIANYGYYGLPAPAYGYGWSRYYDDAVLTDAYGRVYDSRRGVDWSRYEGGYDDGDYGYDDSAYAPAPAYGAPAYGYPGYAYPAPQPEKRSNGGAVTGAVVGGVAGGLIGNRIAGHGNRAVGTILGAGVGAVGGGLIGSASDREKDRRRAAERMAAPPVPYDAEAYRYSDDYVTSGGNYDGRWVGTWYGADGRTYSGEYQGSYQGDARPVPPPPAAPIDGRPHWRDDAPPPPPVAERRAPPPPPAARPVPPPPAALGYSYGYTDSAWYPGVVTTTTVQPSVTTTTYIEEEVTYSAPRRVYRAKAKPRPRPVVRCICR